MKYTEYLKKRAVEVLDGCVLKGADGCDLYTPDGYGNYPALWTRDYAYMAENAGDLIPLEKQKACIEYLMSGVRGSDGWIPDRVDAHRGLRYTAGDDSFPGLENLDNGPFLVIAAEAYLSKLKDEEAEMQFAEWKDILCGGVDCLPVDENGLVVNVTDPPHSPYGFTDCICKTGALAMESLLLWQADGILASRGAGDRYGLRKKKAESVFADTFSDESGMLLAATGIGRQIDVWASCYAVSAGFPLAKAQNDRIADWLAENYDGIVMKGQIRHLRPGEYWEKTLVPVAPGEYQNGAFWATASGWFYDAVEKRYPELAYRMMTDLIDCFENDGIWECINADNYRKLNPYVASATNAYGCCKRHGL